MSDNGWAVSGGAIAGLVILGVVGAFTYSCQKANTQYYEGMRECLARGGSFVPTGTNAWNALCLMNQGK